MEFGAGRPCALWWRGERIALTAAAGPERLAGDWWSDPYRRDYWRGASARGELLALRRARRLVPAGVVRLSDYVELHCHSAFSLLDGASPPETLVARAKALGYAALALTDHDELGGIVAFAMAAREAGLEGIVGAELTVEVPAPDGHRAPGARTSCCSPRTARATAISRRSSRARGWSGRAASRR